MKLSAVILTHSKDEDLSPCLDSLSFCNDITVIEDSRSKITSSLKLPKIIRHFKRELQNDFAAQRNFGLKHAQGEWVLFVDSDEIVSEALQKEILQTLEHISPEINGFYLKRRDWFMKRELKHGETATVSILRLARKNKGGWKGAVHETWEIEGQVVPLKNPLIHNRDISVFDFLNRINRYTDIKAQELYESSIKESFLIFFTKPLGKFFVNYFLKYGFLDGLPGFTLAWLMSWHSLLVRVKLRLLWVNHGSFQFKLV